MKTALVLAAALTLGGRAAAQTTAPSVDLGAAGTWTVSAEPPGAIVLAPGAGGEAVRLDPAGGIPEGAVVRDVASVEGPGGRRVGRIVLVDPDGRTFEALVHAATEGTVPELVWAGRTGLDGDPGERIGAAVLVEDLDRDGRDDILVGRLAEGAAVCGGEPALLHRHAWDWRAGALRPVSGPRPGIDAARAAPAARSETPPPDTVLVPLLEYRAASSAMGDGGDPLRLAAPRGLEDMDERTGWAEGVGGSGRFEFASARPVTGRLEGRWIAVRPMDGTAADAVRMRNRPRTLVASDGAGHAWRLDLPDDRESRSGGTIWFELPEPVGGGCLTATVIDVYPADSAQGRDADVTWISDFQVLADLGPEPDPGVVSAILDDDASSTAADRLLRALGDRAVPAVSALVGTLGTTGSARAAAFLAGRPEPAAGEALAAMILSADDATERVAAEAIRRRGEDATDVLLGLIARPEPAAAQRALPLLGEIGGPAALPVLTARAGDGDDEERAALRAALGSYLRRHPEGASAVLEAASDSPEAALSDLLRAVQQGAPEAAAGIAGVVASRLPSLESFEARYHLVRLAARLPGAGTTPVAGIVLDLARTAPEPGIRTEAALALGSIASPDADLTPLLDDPWPGVREAAARTIGERGVPGEVAALAAKYASETWPRVRAAAAGTFLAGEWPGDDAVGRLLADPSRIVRERVVAALDARGDEPSMAALAAVARTSRESTALRSRAMGSVARHCWPGLKETLVRIIEASVQASATRGDQVIALEAVDAIGVAGPPGARALLEEIAREAPVAPMLAAALVALGTLGDPASRPAIEAHRDETDPAVRDAARAALQALDSTAGRPPRCADR